MGTSVQAFNTMMEEFLGELRETFKEEAGSIDLVLDGFKELRQINARKPMELFVASLAPHSQLVFARNPELFNNPFQLPGGLDLSKLWAAPGVDDDTRNAIWQYISSLFVLGTTVQNLPPQLLETVESVAMSCASQLQSGSMDFGALSGMLMGGLGSMMGPAKPRRTDRARRLT